jgi:hypothetical protein
LLKLPPDPKTTNPQPAGEERKEDMEMMNRAIEDASDFMEMKRKLLKTTDQCFTDAVRAQERQDMAKVAAVPPVPPKHPGENRQQYRARLRAMETAR